MARCKWVDILLKKSTLLGVILIGFTLEVTAQCTASSCNSPIAFPALTSAVQQCATQCNTGADPGPNFPGNNCYDFPNPTVWYEFTVPAGDATIDVDITSTNLSNPYYTIFSTANCSNFQLIQCQQGSGGAVSGTASVAAGNTYLIAVSDDGGNVGNFDLCLTTNPDNSPCLVDNFEVTATSLGSPLTGPYLPGETVSYCYSVDNYIQTNCNWFQGIVPQFGDCWDPASFDAQGQPVVVTTPITNQGSFTNGSWNWYDDGIVTYNNLGGAGSLPDGAAVGAGWFYYDGNAGGDPNSGWGDGNGMGVMGSCDGSTSGLSWSVCFDLTVSSTCAGNDCGVSMKTYSDGEIGGWNQIACVSDLPNFLPGAINCCLIVGTMDVTDVSCTGGSDGGIDLTVSGGGPTYTFLWSNGETTQNISPLSSDYYCVTIDDGNCSAVVCDSVTEPPILIASAGADQTICQNDAVAIGGGPTASGGSGSYTYSWSPAGGLNDVTIANPDASPASTTTYSVTVTDSNGCTDTDNITITVNDLPLSVAEHSGPICAGSTSFTLNETGGDAVSWLWSSDGSATITNVSDQNPGVTGFVDGEIFTVTITDANDCQSISSTTISIEPLPNVVAGDDGPVCSDQTSLNLSETGGDAISWSWSSTGASTITNATDQNPVVTGFANGEIFTVTISDVNGCQNTASTTITVNSIPVAIADNTGPVCADVASVTLNETGGDAISWEWSSNGSATITNINDQNPDATGFADGEIFTVTITDANSCQNTASTTISVNSLPVVDAGPDQSLCAGESTTIGDSPTASGGGGGYVYQWSPSTGLSSDTDANPTASPTSTTTYSITLSDANGCSATDAVVITVNDLPVITSVTLTDATCGNSDGEVCVDVSGNGPFDYDWSSGSSASCSGNISAGAYNVTVSDANLCTASDNYNVNDLGAPNVVITASTNVSCNGGSDGAANTTVTGGVSPYDYSWSSGETSANATALDAGIHSVTVLDASGCIATANVTISQPDPLAISFNYSDVSCNGGGDGQATANPSGGTSGYQYLWDATAGGQTSQTATGLAAGNYCVTITDNNLCVASACVTIAEPSEIVISTTVSDVTCNGQSDGTANTGISGGTSPYIFSWTSGETTANATALNAGAHTLTVEDANGCVTTASVSVSQPDPLGVSFTTTDATCNGVSDGQATANPSGGTPGYQYLWDATAGGQTTATATGLPGGNHCVTITDNNLCSTSACVTVVEPSMIIINTTVTDVSCNGGSDGQASTTVTGGTSPYDFTWTNGETTANATALNAGTHSITVEDASGCIATASVTISQPDLLTVSLTPNDVSCNGGSDGQAMAIPSGGIPSYQYLWDAAAGAQTASTATGLMEGNYCVTVTDNNLCTASACVTIQEPSVITINTTVSDVSCNSGSDGEAIAEGSGGNGPYQYSWNTGQTTPGISGLGEGTYCVTVTDNNLCTQVECITLTEPTVISLSITCTDATTLGGNDGSSQVSASGGGGTYTYQWSDPASQITAQATGLAAGNYQVTVTDNNGCTAVDNCTVNQPGCALSVSLTGQNISCNAGSDGQATISESGGNGPYSYLWDNTAQTTQTITGLSAGVYCVTTTDVNSCTSTACITITEPGALNLTVNCTGVSTLGGSDGSSSVSVSGGNAPFTYVWNDADNQTTATATGLTAGIYSVTVTDNSGCTTVDNCTVSSPVCSINLQASSMGVMCYGLSDGQASVSPSGGISPYVYAWDNGQTVATVTGLSGGVYSVTVSDSTGCADTISVKVSTPGVPLQVDAGEDFSINEGGSEVLYTTVIADTNVVGIGYNWTPVHGLSCTDCDSPVASPDSTITYCVEVTDENGCMDTSCVNVVVIPEIPCGEVFVPNAFSPNGDNSNDLHCVFGNCITSMKMVIYNRWGEKVFESSAQDYCWDGTYRGEMMNAGVFVYYLDYVLNTGERLTQQGNVNLIR